MWNNWKPLLALALFVSQLVLMLVSWLLNAAYPVGGIRSLLSSEGLRWLFGHFADSLATPCLVWLLLSAMAYGCLRHSGLLRRPASYRQRRALTIAMLMLAVIIVVLLLLTVVPHAVLLSATGSLWPSPFSASLVPVVAFSVIVISTAYGVIAGTFNDLAAVYASLLDGIRQGAALLLFYVLLMQVCNSVLFVFFTA